MFIFNQKASDLYLNNLNTFNILKSNPRYFTALLSILQAMPQKSQKKIPKKLQRNKKIISKYKNISPEKFYDIGQTLSYIMNKKNITKAELLSKLNTLYPNNSFTTHTIRKLLDENQLPKLQKVCFKILNVTEDQVFEIAKKKRFITCLACDFLSYKHNESIDYETLMYNLSYDDALLFNTILHAFYNMDSYQ